MPLTIQDVRREVRTALSRVRILDSDTIEISAGSHPLQPSVKTGALSGVGDIFGPTITTPNAIAIWANSDGTALADSPILIDPATGELKLDGNKLTLSEDGLTSIQSLSPTFLSLLVNNVGVMNWTDTQIQMTVPLSLGTNKPLTFSLGTELKSSGVNELDLLLDSFATVSFRETFTSFATDVLLNDNVIVLSDTEEISGTGGVVALKVAGDNQVVWSDNLLELGIGSALPYVISSRAPQTGAVSLFVIKGADAISGGAGGTLKFQGGAFQGFGNAAGTVQLATPQGTVRLEVLATGSLNLNSTVISTTGAIQGAPSVQVDDGGIIGVDNNNKWVITAGLLHSWTINGVLAATLSDTSLDGNSVLRLTNFAGHRGIATFGFPNQSTATDKALLTTGNANSSNGGLFIPDRAGSIIGIGAWTDVNVIGTGGDVEFRSFVGNGGASLTVTIESVIVGNQQKATATAAQGTYPFVAGDHLTVRRFLTNGGPGQITTDDVGCTLLLEYD